MSYGFLDIASTPSVRSAQRANDPADTWGNFSGDRAFNEFTPAELSFIAERDQFYLASVSETGWPYVQHRGGPVGFLRAIDSKTLAFPDYRGNRQYISVGNIAANNRVAMILVDYPNKSRLKIYALAESKALASDPELALAVATKGYRAKAERAVILHLQAFDWNCPQHITPRYTEEEVKRALSPALERIKALEAEVASLRAGGTPD